MVALREGSRRLWRYKSRMPTATGPIMIRSERRRMIDEAMDAYVEWREECIRVWDAYQRWLGAARGDAELAFPAYVAALDREERASEVYAGLIMRLYPLVAT
jgi:hypothetical protein